MRRVRRWSSEVDEEDEGGGEASREAATAASRRTVPASTKADALAMTAGTRPIARNTGLTKATLIGRLERVPWRCSTFSSYPRQVCGDRRMPGSRVAPMLG